MMLKRSILVGVFLFLASALMVACDNREPVGVPPTATPSAAATGTATATAIAAAAVSPSPSLTTTAELTATATVTATLPPEVVVLEAVNIRSGPSTDYPIVGYVAGDNWLVTGRSADGLWWRIQCPEGTPSDECWITASETAVEPVGKGEAPLAAAPPLPTATPAPTATPCVVGSRSGWTTYQVVSGDTLSSIAARFGGSAGQIMAANCLSSDAIATGSSLWVPAGSAAVAVAPSQPLTPQPPDQSLRVPDGIEASLPFENPNLGSCRLIIFSDTATTLMIVPDPSVDGGWEILATACLYVRGLNAGETPIVTVKDPDGNDVQIQIRQPGPGRPFAIVSFINRHATGEFQATANVDAVSTPSPLKMKALPASGLRLRTSAKVVERGKPLMIEFTGFPELRPLFLYGARSNSDEPCERLQRDGLDTSDQPWCFIKPLGIFMSSPTAIGNFEIATDDLVPGNYRVDPGVALDPTPEMLNQFQVTSSQ